MDYNDLPTEFNAGAVKRSSCGQWGLVFVVVACIICPILTASSQLYVESSHRPQLVLPPEAQAFLRTVTPGKPFVNEDLLKQLLKAYELDPCVVGKKYGAVCKDGEVMFSRSEDVCSDHGGVKEWIECR